MDVIKKKEEEIKQLAKYLKHVNNIIRKNTFLKELYLCASEATIIRLSYNIEPGCHNLANASSLNN